MQVHLGSLIRGEELVKMCYETGIRVTSVRDRRHVLQRLQCQDFRQEDLHLRHFFRQIRKEREEVLKEMAAETRTIVMYEAPHRLVKTLKLLSERLGDRKSNGLQRTDQKA